jgi:hypothetical protein
VTNVADTALCGNRGRFPAGAQFTGDSDVNPFIKLLSLASDAQVTPNDSAVNRDEYKFRPHAAAPVAKLNSPLRESLVNKPSPAPDDSARQKTSPAVRVGSLHGNVNILD